MSQNSVKLGSLINLQSLSSPPSSPQAGDIYYDSSLNSFQFYNGTSWQTYLPSDGSVPATANLDMGGFLINNLGDPLVAQDAATKSYVDSTLTGLDWKSPVMVVATSSIPLSGAAPLAAIDGVSLAFGDSVLLAGQTTGAGADVDNGIYVYTDAGASTYSLVRRSDSQTGEQLLQAACFATEGTANHDTAWVNTANAPIVVGTTPLPFVLFASTVGGANTSLSNLTPTAVNQDLLPNASLTRSLGSGTLPWSNSFTNVVSANVFQGLGNNTGSTNYIYVQTPDNASGQSGDLGIRTGTSSGSNRVGTISIMSGGLAGANILSGPGVIIQTGSGTVSAEISMNSGDATGASGAVLVSSGIGSSSGPLNFLTGNASGASGNILIQTGTGATRGNISISGRAVSLVSSINLITLNSTLGFSGSEIQMLSPGAGLTVSAGDSGAGTDLVGGNLLLESGSATGDGAGYVMIRAVAGGQGAGSASRAVQQVALFSGSGMSLASDGGTSAPAASALLDLQSTTGALLLSRLTTVEDTALTASNGMVIYNTNLNVLRVRQGGAWASVVTGVAGANKSLSNLDTTSINQDLLPDASNAHDLGSSSAYWNNLWAGNVYANTLGTISGSNIVSLSASAISPINSDSINLGSSASHFLGLHVRQGSFYDSLDNLRVLMDVDQAGPGAITTDWSANLVTQGSLFGLGITTSNSSATDGTATSGIFIGTGDKTAGTGGSGGIYIFAGTSSTLGARGEVSIGGYNVTLAADNSITLAASDVVVIAGGAYLSLSNLGQVKNVVDPTDLQDATTKNYVDGNFVSRAPAAGSGVVVTDATTTNIVTMAQKSSIFNYQLVRSGQTQTGMLMVSGDGGSVADVADVSSATGSLGITFSAASVAGSITVSATASSTGFNADMNFVTAFLAA